MPSVRVVGGDAFQYCTALTSAVFGKDLEIIERNAFIQCVALRRIIIPLKDNFMIVNNAFFGCMSLSRVDTIGGKYETVSTLHMETWRNEMEEELDSINQTLLDLQFEKGEAIYQWITRVLGRIEHYKSEHQILLKEAMTLLELALWKAKLLNELDEKKCNVNEVTKKAKIDAQAARKEHRVTCGASIVIKNVLPFLAMK